ncbi:pimeloyl-ACP methyl ester carboxylesterase [Mumia flava]|uniref:Pimeloyl-ACP methyl ester carboxylesterase n=1 Tax=Mumia flava TaxID=1348852 RepID=A0A0B2BNR5_9ACTN|nr:alpha/beta hydrolase [Mumia flava]PJJ57208.1 pimeloyl-ACP methyl ester carboxylesterase [Mumia flava]
MTWGEQQQITLGALTFDVRTAGPDDGDPVLLLHGFPETSACWSDVAARLAEEGLRAIAPDQRGYSPGARPEHVADYATDAMVDDALGILDALGYERAHVVGHDWGASVAWRLAAAHPERVRSLTAVSVPHLSAYNWALSNDPDQQKRSEYIRLFRQEGKAEEVLLAEDARRLRAMYGEGVAPEQIDEYVAVLGEPDALTAALAWYRAMGPELARTSTVTVPTTYVWSDDDMAIGGVGARRCGRHVAADYRFVALEGITHWIPEQAPDALADAILERVASVR